MSALTVDVPTYQVVDLDPDDRPAWLAWRRGGIGASEAAALLGVSPWASPLSVYAEKIDDEPPLDDDAEHLRWGRLLEDPILDEFEHRTGLDVRARQLCVENTDRPWMRATLDGLTDAGLVEVKVSGDHQPWDEPPLHYQAQVAWQLAVTGLGRGWLVALFNARRLEIYPIDADDDVTADLHEVADEFWARVADRRPPPADGHPATGPTLARLYPGDPDHEPVVVPEALAAEVKAARDAVKVAEDAKRAAENALKAALGDATEAVITDGVDTAVVATWRPQTRRTWNTDALARAAGIDPNDRFSQHYRTETVSRVLRVK